jgi:hypothetical protein
MPRKNFGEFIHHKLAEPEGQQFVHGKFRFWLPTVLFLSVLNSILTGLIFRDDTQESYISPIMLSVGALLAWLCVGCLHYSDSTDRRLARGVAGLDSVTLLFVVCHFAGLMYAYGHLKTIQSAERKCDAAAATYNAKAGQLSQDKAKMLETAERIAIETRKTEKLRNDTAYQQRRTVEAGGKIQTGPSAGGITAEISTAQVELEKPTKPDETSAHFLGEWDWLIRVFNFGELMLAAITLVFIRNQSAKTNSPASAPAMNFDSLLGVAARTPAAAPAYRKTHVSDEQEKTRKTHVSFDPEGLKRLRETLKDISFRLAGMSFKADVKDDCVWIRMMRANQGTQETVSAAKAKLDILNDAMTMPRDKFRERLERFLRENQFEI